MEAMSVGCYKQISAIKQGVIMRLQCNNKEFCQSVRPSACYFSEDPYSLLSISCTALTVRINQKIPRSNFENSISNSEQIFTEVSKLIY